MVFLRGSRKLGTSHRKRDMRALNEYLRVENLKGIPSRQGTKRVSGKLWPTGEFSYGTFTERPDERLDDRPPEFHYEDAPAPLDSTNLPNSHSEPQCLVSAGSEGTKKETAKRGKYGRRGITGYGKKMLKSGCLLMEEDSRRFRLTFATITLPPLPDEVRRSVSEDWGRLTNRLMQWLSRRLERQGLPKLIAAATEVQPGRLKETAEAYLHLHLVWPNHRKRSKGWAVNPNDVRTWLISYLSKHHGVSDIEYINIDTQQVRESASGYIAKYISKGSEEVDGIIADLGESALPGQWWAMTKDLKNWVWSVLQSGVAVGERLAQWLNWAFDYDDFSFFRYIHHVEVPINGALVTIGWRGCLTNEALELWDDVDRSATAA